MRLTREEIQRQIDASEIQLDQSENEPIRHKLRNEIIIFRQVLKNYDNERYWQDLQREYNVIGYILQGRNYKGD